MLTGVAGEVAVRRRPGERLDERDRCLADRCRRPGRGDISGNPGEDVKESVKRTMLAPFGQNIDRPGPLPRAAPPAIGADDDYR